MKIINKFFLLFVFASLITSCNDAIEIDQPGRLGADQAFRSVSDLQLGLLGAYGNLDSTHEILFNAVFTDEIALGLTNGGQGLTDGSYGFILNSTSTAPTNIWTTNYAVLNSVNRVIAAAAAITPEAGEEDQYNDILGQCYALRAYAHFTLLSYYSTDYTDDSALAVILLDFVPEVSQSLPRNTNGEIFTSIISDLDLAAGLIDPAGADPLFFTVDGTIALRARVALYRGQYATAGTLAADLLTRYPIADQGQFFNMWDDADTTEQIFSIDRAIADNFDNQGTNGGGWAGSLFANVDPTISGAPFFEMGRAVFNLYDAADIRRARFVGPDALINPGYATDPLRQSTDVLNFFIYPGSGGQPLLNDLKVFRSAEMLFIQAESLADAGDLVGAATLIQQLRTARLGAAQPLPVYANETEAFGAILDERRQELVAQGHRYLDLKRIGARGNREVLREPTDCAVNGACSLPVSDFRFTLPIPQVELNANVVIRDQQNPGY
ncbi:RagB/SusD family nutrient uptake outer membrane protein [Aquimarina sp. 2201CG14-23]|uniref:RagB/SusD family nutrient uptake outer membrane protein n=1 Tax=Aquimarina mycalae TaxID=3040073 RepID=UPI002477E712|nr:RagB/SusD family nutrient uptake outer membrane protein [Aquimarina sp. 2201CG14-23]MDH7444781.1 RagB/SusD family nutrient uptake outer membrane protein [Aquimarina sp. 2201CG14-23]